MPTTTYGYKVEMLEKLPPSSNSHIGTDTKEDKADAPLEEESIHPTEDAETTTMEQEGSNNEVFTAQMMDKSVSTMTLRSQTESSGPVKSFMINQEGKMSLLNMDFFNNVMINQNYFQGEIANLAT